MTTGSDLLSQIEQLPRYRLGPCGLGSAGDGDWLDRSDVLALVRAAGAPQDWIEQRLRQEWWTGHGCAFSALYGDDGEMQCNALTCMRDFKREPMEALRAHVETRRLTLAAAVLSSPPVPAVRASGAQECPTCGSPDRDLHPLTGRDDSEVRMCRDGWHKAAASVRASGEPQKAPRTQCPKCRTWQDDLDGFGVLKCQSCDYCAHPSIDGDTCNLCGRNPDRPTEAFVLAYIILIEREDSGEYFASWTTGDRKEGGCAPYSTTVVGALAELCATLLKVDEDKSVEARAAASPSDDGARQPQLDLEQIKAREAAATKGPWEQHGQLSTHAVNGTVNGRSQRVVGGDTDGYDGAFRKSGIIQHADAEFIAHARQDIPALVSEIERLRAVLEGK